MASRDTCNRRASPHAIEFLKRYQVATDLAAPRVGLAAGGRRLRRAGRALPRSACFPGRGLGLRRRRRQFDQAEWRAVGEGLTHQRQRHVVDRDSAAGAPFGAARVGVAVEDGRRRVAVERLLQPAGAEEREDLRRLALDGGRGSARSGGRRPLRGPQPRQGRLQLQRLVDGLLDEVLDRRLAPGLERPAAEAAAEALDPREADAVDLAGVAVEQDDAGLREDPPRPRPAGRTRSRGCRAPRRWGSSRRPPSPRPGRGPPRAGRSRSGRRRGPGRPLPRRPARRGPGRSRGRSWCSGGRRPPPGG